MEAVDLTYRTDLRELNELNFARSDAKLEQLLAELRAELRTEFRIGLHGLRADRPYDRPSRSVSPVTAQPVTELDLYSGAPL